MQQEIAEALDAAVPLTFDVRKAYSGRGMYGKKTWGIATDNDSDFMRAVALVASDPEEYSLDPEIDFSSIAASFKKDSMGRGIIYY